MLWENSVSPQPHTRNPANFILHLRILRLMRIFRILLLLPPGALILLAFTLVMAGRIGFFEGAGLSLSVFFGSCLPVLKAKRNQTWVLADLLIATAAAVLLLVDDSILRIMLLAPILMMANWLVWWALNSRFPLDERSTLRIPTISFALSILFLGPFLLQGPSTSFLLRIPAVLIIPVLAIPAGPVVVFLAGILSVAASPSSVVLLAVFLLLFWFRRKYRRPEMQDDSFTSGISLLGPVVGIAILFMSMFPWGIPPFSRVYPGLSWVSWVGFFGVVLLSFRFPPASAGAMAVLCCLLLGPPRSLIQGVSAGFRLSRIGTEARLGETAGEGFGLDLSMVGGEGMRVGDVAARLEIGRRRVPLRIGEHLVESSLLSERGTMAQSLPDDLMIRPPEKAGEAWRVSVRSRIPVKPGSEVRIVRNPRIPPQTEIRVEAAGPESRVGSRDSEEWLWISAALVALFQLFSGLWQMQGSWVPWSFLVSGMAINRAFVEPLNTSGGRIGIFLAISAVFCVLIPWIGKWMREHRS